MTKLFLEYERNKKTKDNPELLVGQTRYWSEACYLNTPLTYHPDNVFRITDVISSNIVKYRCNIGLVTKPYPIFWNIHL